MNKITEIIPDNLPKHLQDAMDEGQFFNYVVNNMAPISKLEELIELYEFGEKHIGERSYNLVKEMKRLISEAKGND